ISNLLLLHRIAETGKPVILSSGLSDWKELDTAIQFLHKKNIHLSLLQCATAYPAPPSVWGLNVIQEFKPKYQIPVGFSDHSGDIYACLAAAALGAEILEFHVVFDKKMFGPDATSSLTILQTKTLMDGIKQIESENNSRVQKVISNEQANLKTMFGKSLAVNCSLKAGQAIELKFLESKKPGNQGIPASQFEKVIGKTLRIDKSQWDFLQEKDLI